jgi:hypothetical protein
VALLCAATARADDSGGLVMEINVLGVNTLGTSLPTAVATAPSIAPSVAFGFGFGGTNAILANIGLLAYGPGTNVGFSVNPLFRHYWAAPHVGGVSPFFEAGVLFGLLSPAGGNVNWLVGATAGAGAEWMFVEHLSLIADALVEYGHTHNTYATTLGAETNVDQIGFAGNIGIVIHW